MRTTIVLPESLAKRAKAKAARDGRTFTSLVEEALHVALEEADGEPAADHVPLPTSGTAGSAVLIDFDDPEAVAAALGDDEWSAPKRRVEPTNR